MVSLPPAAVAALVLWFCGVSEEGDEADHDLSLDDVDEAARTENDVDASVLFVLASEAAAAVDLLVGMMQGC